MAGSNAEPERCGPLIRQRANEKFFATLKKELIYRISAYHLSMKEVKTFAFWYVFVYYNRVRVYTSNPGGWSPEVW